MQLQWRREYLLEVLLVQLNVLATLRSFDRHLLLLMKDRCANRLLHVIQVVVVLEKLYFALEKLRIGLRLHDVGVRGRQLR